MLEPIQTETGITSGDVSTNNECYSLLHGGPLTWRAEVSWLLHTSDREKMSRSQRAKKCHQSYGQINEGKPFHHRLAHHVQLCTSTDPLRTNFRYRVSIQVSDLKNNKQAVTRNRNPRTVKVNPRMKPIECSSSFR